MASLIAAVRAVALGIVLNALVDMPVVLGAEMGPEQMNQGGSNASLEEVVVTARKREEKLQDVPDAVTALTQVTLENANVQTLGDFTAFVPNLNFRDGSAYAVGFYDLSMRGIGQGQQGWPSVAFIVDGVPADSPDALTANSLQDVERIEVLRGPQSALYGAGAIAGAINVVTKRPTEETRIETRLAYGNGSDKQANGSISGALIPGELLARVSADYRDFDGVIKSGSNGIPLDFRVHKQVQARLIFSPTSNFEADVRGSYVTDHNGSTYQDNLPSPAYINDFSSMYNARRMTPGTDDRSFGRASVRLQLDLAPFSIISISSYSKTNEHGWVDICYDDPNNPLYPRLPDGGIACLSGTESYGASARAGQAIDNIFASRDVFKTYSEDFRIESSKATPLQWLIGASGMHRDAMEGFNTLNIIAPTGAYDILFPDWNAKKDVWWGVYGQASIKLRDAWELTVDARYDHQRYENTAYTNATLSTIAPTYTVDGRLVPTQVQQASSFQPKGQISYHIDADRMIYGTVSRGFRAGYFNTGSYSVPEHTTNYELGVKSEWLDRRLSANFAIFHIDYSNQQSSTNISAPPYRVPSTIPKTKIDGAEWETSALIARPLTLSAAVGYLNARVADGSRSPMAPLFSGTLSAQLLQPMTGELRLNARADLTFHSPEFLQIQNTERIPDNRFLNLRAGIEMDKYGVYAYGRNVTSTRETDVHGAFLGTHYLRYQNVPATYGVELRAKF
jgi:iron complex outermembrane receptor protein